MRVPGYHPIDRVRRALTWDLYISRPASNLFHLYEANHHFLNSVLARLSTGLFGVSEWSMRLPALAGAALYFVACYRLTRLAFGDGFSMLLAVALMTLNPFILDFMVAARGYGLAQALWTWAAAVLLDAFLRQTYPPRQMAAAGSALALSVTANLVYVLPAAALAGMTLYLIRGRAASLPIPIAEAPKKTTASPSHLRDARKNKKKASRRTQPGRSPWVWFVLPIAAIALLFLNVAPFERMRSGQFYTGASTVRESLRSLASSSLEHSGPLRNQGWIHQSTDVVAFVIPTLIAAGLIAGVRRRNLVLILAAGTAVFSGVALLLIHLVLDTPYPSDRTGLYFLPLAPLVLVGLAYGWRDQKGPARAASFTAYAAGAILTVYFITETNTRKFLVWEYDADTRSMGEYMASHRPKGQEIVRIGGSWQLQESLVFYAYLRDWTWIELRKGTPVADLDYYALVPHERAPVEQKLSLREIYLGPVSGSALAKP